MSHNEKTTVANYGIHWDIENVAYLMQGRSGTNAIGSARPAPFDVRPPGRSRHCNHQIPVAAPIPNDRHWDYFLQMIEDPLVKAMLPIPKADGGVYFIEEKGNVFEILVLLSKLSSPIYGIVQPMWNMNAPKILEELRMTNVQPLVISDCKAKDSATISQIAKAAVNQPRTVIFAGDSDVVIPRETAKIGTSLNFEVFDKNDLVTLPWEILGAVVTRKYMRGQWPPEANPAGKGSNERSSASTSTRESRNFTAKAN